MHDFLIFVINVKRSFKNHFLYLEIYNGVFGFIKLFNFIKKIVNSFVGFHLKQIIKINRWYNLSIFLNILNFQIYSDRHQRRLWKYLLHMLVVLFHKNLLSSFIIHLHLLDLLFHCVLKICNNFLVILCFDYLLWKVSFYFIHFPFFFVYYALLVALEAKQWIP